MNGIKLKKLLSFVSRPRRREDVSWGECVGSSVRLQVIQLKGSFLGALVLESSISYWKSHLIL